MNTGKLYGLWDEKFISTVNYKLYKDSETNWWGELTFSEYLRIRDGDGYMLVLEDNRKGRCSLKKRVNKAVVGVAPLFYYQFKASGPLK